MKKLISLFPLFAVAATLLAGCSDDKEEQVYSGITIATDRVVDLAYDATRFTVGYTLVGNAVGKSIEVRSDAPWLTVRSVSSDAVILTIEPNYLSPHEETASREASVELLGEGIRTLTMTFRQAGFVPDPVIEITGPQPVVIGKEDLEALIAYRLLYVKDAKAVVKAKSKADWLKVKKVEPQQVILTVDPEGAGEREGIVVLSYGKAESVEVTVRQQDAEI